MYLLTHSLVLVLVVVMKPKELKNKISHADPPTLSLQAPHDSWFSVPLIPCFSYCSSLLYFVYTQCVILNELLEPILTLTVMTTSVRQHSEHLIMLRRCSACPSGYTTCNNGLCSNGAGGGSSSGGNSNPNPAPVAAPTPAPAPTGGSSSSGGSSSG